MSLQQCNGTNSDTTDIDDSSKALKDFKLTGKTAQEQVWNMCKKEGMSDFVAVVVLGNADGESGFDNNATDSTGLGDSIGVFQFTDDEKDAFLKWSNDVLALEDISRLVVKDFLSRAYVLVRRVFYRFNRRSKFWNVETLH